MKITCIDKEARKILETGYYQIPRFQRPYSWEKEHINDFWNDTILESQTDYFIGSIVVYKKGDEHFGIVDGQQRLTTITMSLCALREFYLAEGEENLAKGVQSLVERTDLNNKKNFILQTETSYPYFQEHIQKYGAPESSVGYSEEETNLKSGYDQIFSFIKTRVEHIRKDKTILASGKSPAAIAELNNIRDKFLKLKVIYIELDDEDDAYVIFETLNTRGKDLSVADLIKNFLVKNISAPNRGVDLPKDKWNSIREQIEGISTFDVDLDSFLLHVWLSKYDATTTKTLFKKVKAEIKPADAKTFLESLVSDSKIYKHIFDPEDKKWNRNELALKVSLLALNSFRVTQQTPMVLAVMRSFSAGKLKFRFTKQILEAVEHFHYMFNAVTSQRSSGSIASMYSTFARRLNAASSENETGVIIKDLQQRMREKLPTYDEFLPKFKELKFTDEYTKQKKIIQYTLTKIDRALNHSGLAINYDNMTLEHIMPQKPATPIANHDSYVGMMGNLIFLSERLNGSLANKGFATKKTSIIQSGIYTGPSFTQAVKWDHVEIESRTEELAKLAYTQVFKI